MNKRIRFPEAKQYFLNLYNNTGMEVAKEILDEYEDINKQVGIFFAAKYLVDVYEDFMQNMNKNSKKDEVKTYGA